MYLHAMALYLDLCLSVTEARSVRWVTCVSYHRVSIIKYVCMVRVCRLVSRIAFVVTVLVVQSKDFI